MNFLLTLTNHAWVHQVGWMLLHTVWEGTIIAVIFALLRSGLRARSSNARYLLGCSMLVLMFVAPILTVFIMPPDRGIQPPGSGISLPFGLPLPSHVYPATQTVDRPDLFVQISRWTGVLDGVTPWIIPAWLLGVLIGLLRWVQGSWWLRQLRTVEIGSVDAVWLEVLEDLKARFNLTRPVRLMSSALAEVPMVIGWLRPMILLPAGSLAGLTPIQFEAILAHELAHVRRYDYLVNAFQNLLETVLFFHPAVWWISRCVRLEREHCCDDMVVRICRDRLAYARALFKLEELRAASPQLALAASGGSLLHRIRRLISPSKPGGPLTAREFCGFTLLLLGCILGALGCVLLTGTELYSSAARLKIEHSYAVPSAATSQEQGGFFSDPWFIQTEFEVIQSELILGKVIEELDLDKQWSRQLGRVLKPAESVESLKHRLELRPVRNTSILEVRAYDPNPNRAAEIANKIAEIYRKYRVDQASGVSVDSDALAKQLKQQELLVAESRTKLNRLRTDLKIDNKALANDAPSLRLSAETLRKVEGLRLESQAEYVRSKVLLEKLKTLPSDELAQAIPTTGIQDPLLPPLLEQLDLAKQKLAALTIEYGPEHSEVRKISSQIAELRERINDRTKGFLLGYSARVDSLAQGLNDLSNAVAEAAQEDIMTANSTAPYFQAKRELEEQERLRQMLRLKIESQKTETPRNSPVEIVDRASPASYPSRPNRPLAVSGIASGVLLALCGLVLARRRPRKNRETGVLVSAG
ncbi:MAG TPA: M56 family metallopeptidase [Candidatus Limnocylindrales bacterium]|nr:M56 family metallopeptidase [Candidatus Limnocylindrales bacterium]